MYDSNYMISGKCKTMEIVKSTVVARDEVCIGMSIQSTVKEFLGQ